MFGKKEKEQERKMAIEEIEAEMDKEAEEVREKVKKLSEKDDVRFFKYYVGKYHSVPNAVKYSDIEHLLSDHDKKMINESLKIGEELERKRNTVQAEVLDNDGNVVEIKQLPVVEGNKEPITIPVLDKIDSTRFHYDGVYDENALLEGILDNIIMLSRKHTYSIEKLEDLKTYKLIIKDAVTGSVVSQFDLDAKYISGLGIPMIKVPITNGMGQAIFDWVPLGMGEKLANTLFANNPMVSLSQIPMADMVPAANVIRAERSLWPDKRLYQFIDMSNVIIRSGKDYQDFGYYLYQVMVTLNSLNIHGRFRPSKYESPNNFEIISDAAVQYPDGMPEKKADVAVRFFGGKIIVESLLDNTKRQDMTVNFVPYPDMANVAPLTFGESETDVVKIVDTAPYPKQLSEAEKDILLKMPAAGPITYTPQIDPDKDADISKEISGLFEGAETKNLLDALRTGKPA